MNKNNTIFDSVASDFIQQADALAEKGLFELAGEKYEAGIHAFPEDASLAVKYGNFLLGQGDDLKAYAVYQKAAFYEPENGKVFSLMGLVLIHLGRLDEAEVCLQKAIELNPEDQNSVMLLSGLKEEKGSWDGVLRAVETLMMILNFADQPQQLKEILKRVDSNLLALVKANAFTAREDQSLQLADNLDELAHNIENIIAERILED
jgi:tetratricopeptide (TPR) repeat protein